MDGAMPHIAGKEGPCNYMHKPENQQNWEHEIQTIVIKLKTVLSMSQSGDWGGKVEGDSGDAIDARKFYAPNLAMNTINHST